MSFDTVFQHHDSPLPPPTAYTPFPLKRAFVAVLRFGLDVWWSEVALTI